MAKAELVRVGDQLKLYSPWTASVHHGPSITEFRKADQTLALWGVTPVEYGDKRNYNPHGALRIARDGVSLKLREQYRYPIELFTNLARRHDGLQLIVTGTYDKDEEKFAANLAALPADHAAAITACVRKALPDGQDAAFGAKVKDIKEQLDSGKLGSVTTTEGEAVKQPLRALIEDCPMVKPFEVAKFMATYPAIDEVHVHDIGLRISDWPGEGGKPRWGFAGGQGKLRRAKNGVFLFMVRDTAKKGDEWVHVENTYPGHAGWSAGELTPELWVDAKHPPDNSDYRRFHWVVRRVPLAGVRSDGQHRADGADMVDTALDNAETAADTPEEYHRDVSDVGEDASDAALRAAVDDTCGVSPTRLKLAADIVDGRVANVFRSAIAPDAQLDLSGETELKFKIALTAGVKNHNDQVGPVLKHLQFSESGTAYASDPSVTAAALRDVATQLVSQCSREMLRAPRAAADYHANAAVARDKTGVYGRGPSESWSEYVERAWERVRIKALVAIGGCNVWVANAGPGAWAWHAETQRRLNNVIDLGHPGAGYEYTMASIWGLKAGGLAKCRVIASHSVPVSVDDLGDHVKVRDRTPAPPSPKCVGLLYCPRVCDDPSICDVRSPFAIFSAIRKNLAPQDERAEPCTIGIAGTRADLLIAAAHRLAQGIGMRGAPYSADRVELEDRLFAASIEKAAIRAKFLEGEALYFAGENDFDPQTGLLTAGAMPKFERKKSELKDDRLIINVKPVDYYRSAQANSFAADGLVANMGVPPRGRRHDKAAAFNLCAEAAGGFDQLGALSLDEEGADSNVDALVFAAYAAWLHSIGAISPGHPYYEFLVKIRGLKLYADAVRIVTSYASLMSGHSGTYSIQTFRRGLFAVVHLIFRCGFQPNEFDVGASAGDDMTIQFSLGAFFHTDEKGRFWWHADSIAETGKVLGMRMKIESPVDTLAEGAHDFLGGTIVYARPHGGPDQCVHVPSYSRSIMSIGALPINQWDLPSVVGRLVFIQDALLDRFNGNEYRLPVLGALGAFAARHAAALVRAAPVRANKVRAIGDEMWGRSGVRTDGRGYSVGLRRAWSPDPPSDHWLRRVCQKAWGIEPGAQLVLEQLCREYAGDDEGFAVAWAAAAGV